MVVSRDAVQGQGVQLAVSRIRMGDSTHIEELLRRRSRTPVTTESFTDSFNISIALA
jgi:hypothetical protein